MVAFSAIAVALRTGLATCAFGIAALSAILAGPAVLTYALDGRSYVMG
jgi:hypothetical protein